MLLCQIIQRSVLTSFVALVSKIVVPNLQSRRKSNQLQNYLEYTRINPNAPCLTGISREWIRKSVRYIVAADVLMNRIISFY